jgi:putative membrane protein
MVREIHRLQGRVFLALAIACSAVSGCGDESGAETPAKPERPMESLSAGQIVGIVNVIHQGEVKQAEDQLKNEGVRDYAQTLAREHKDAEADLATVLEKLRTPSESSNLQKQLDLFGQNMTQLLDREKPEKVDVTFLEVQIVMHRQALTIVEEQLLPQAKEPEMKAYLENMKTDLSQHLWQARNLRKQFPADRDR